MDSLSKTYGMPGWRAGFMVGPEVVAKAVTIMNSNHITNIPEIVTAAAVAALSGPQDVPDAKRAEFQAKRDQVVAALNAIPGVVCPTPQRSEEHTSELQSLMRISYAVFCLKKQNATNYTHNQI